MLFFFNVKKIGAKLRGENNEKKHPSFFAPCGNQRKKYIT